MLNYLFLLLFTLPMGFASAQQHFDLVFFQKQKKAKQSAIALLPLKLDTTIVFEKAALPEKPEKYIKVTDTLRFDNFYALKNAADFKHIAHLGDSATEMLKIPIITLPHSDPQYKIVTDTKLKLPSRKTVEFTGKQKQEMLYAEHWKFSDLPAEYYQAKESILIAYKEPPLEILPLEYIIAFHPKKDLSEEERKLILVYCSSFTTRERIEIIPAEITFFQKKHYINRVEKLRVVQEATTRNVIVYSSPALRRLLPRLKGKLQKLAYYQGPIDRELSDDFKIALMKFQVANNFPIGQFEVGGIDFLLSLAASQL